MALADLNGARDGGHDAPDAFLEHSHLTYIIPFATEFNPEAALREGGGSVESRIANIEQRDQLFFDEAVDIYFILRTPCANEQTLRRQLPRLVVTLETHIVNGAASDRDGPPSSETIHTGEVEDIEQALVVADEGYVYAVWKTNVFLGRPRMRLQLPSVLFVGAANLRLSAAASDQSGGLGSGYMQNCTPSGMNLLESFADDPYLGGIKPQLSAQRVSRVAPLTKPKDALHRINGLQSFKLKIFPVLHARVRFSRPNTAPPSAALVALLETDFTPYFDCEAALDKITLGITDGTVEDLNCQDGMGLPLSCVAHDHLTFLYKVAPQQLDLARKTPSAQELVITIEVIVLVRPEGEPNPCTPRLTMTWTTALDFTPPVNPGFGKPMSHAIRRSHRPSQLSIGGGVDSQPMVSPSVTRPDALPTLEAATAHPIEASIPDFGITMTFTGPSEPVHVGQEFTWTVFVVNRTRPDVSASPITISAGTPPPQSHHHHPRTAAAAAAPPSRKLMLAAIPRRRRNEQRVTRPPSTALESAARRDALIADAVLDENVVHAMQRSSVVDCAELACLSADVRVGPLAPGACAVAELRFLALRAGVVGVEAVRVVDLGSQEHVDVRELPLVVAVEKGGV
ncbi:hypothetical protein BT67DRAFT_425513 [Trichocladium antarcticum]|uniref:Trafficking protein particle complex II-specific subunit 65 IgD3 domain-containing protein n=1 Tax=Trichocladium antarcticum TaxID=1450529 RepID=A0AAN6UH41_9PEZI|nr:hypothetical protein BT67DRAFT_425513 [Trichocladium antarcticum]